MQHRVERVLADADAVLFVLNGAERIGAGDRYIARAIRSAGTPAVTAVNKVDRLKEPATIAALAGAADLGVQGEIFPVSAKRGQGVDALLEHLVTLLPDGPMLYPPEDRSDLSENVRIAELVREQVLRRTREEVPHAVEVEVAEIAERDDGLIAIEANVWAEVETQKAILIGAGGRMIKAIGSAARKEIEASLGRRVHLELRVRVRRGWRADDALLDRLGIE
jgi:GTP-binding protein Era